MNVCMNECPEKHGKCSSLGSYKCFDDAPQCVFQCPSDPSLPSASRYWSLLLNCSASGDECVCREYGSGGDLSTCMVSGTLQKACAGELVQ
jgi:hypothetical protein